MPATLVERSPGRNCPLAYRYAPAALRGLPALRTDTLWVAGGLYGNTVALQSLLDLYVAEPGEKALVFNGDFHWFDVEQREFELVNETVLGFHATRGNVETELASPAEGAGCGCAYPEWVGEATVVHSNRIMERLRASARQSGAPLEALSALPMHLVARIGDARIGIVHGDASSLAGWGFSQEALSTRQGQLEARRALEAAQVEGFASSHTCLPVLQSFPGGGFIANNGAAGMPNFRGEMFGVATRISTEPYRGALYAIRHGALFIEAVPLRYDVRAWQERFLMQWPPGSSAHRSYWERIVGGPDYHPHQAVRGERLPVPRVIV
jgi:hypothetical protein